MQFQAFAISALTGEGADELNQFLGSHRVVSVEKRFLDRELPQWCVCVEYLAGPPKDQEKRPRIDYREVLSSEDFAVYAKLRDLRKKVAEDEGLPLYTVFTNEQLARMVQNRVRDRKGLSAISGIGSSKMEKFADVFLDCLDHSLEVS